MKIKRLEIVGAIPFKDGVAIDWSDAQSVAVVGDNGSGKSTLLDCICLALYGTAPNSVSSTGGKSSGVIYEIFPTKNGKIDYEFWLGSKHYKIVRLINGASQKQTAFLYEDGKALSDGKISEFPAALAKVWPVSEELFLASIYATQKGKGSFTSMDEKTARALLDDVLGLGVYDRDLEATVEEQKRVEQHIAIEERGLAVLGESVGVDVLEVQRKTKEGEKSDIETAIKENRGRVADLQKAKATLEAGSPDLDVLRRRAAECAELLGNSEELVKERKKRIEKNQTGLLDQADAIYAAVERAQVIRKERQAAAAKLAEVEAQPVDDEPVRVAEKALEVKRASVEAQRKQLEEAARTATTGHTAAIEAASKVRQAQSMRCVELESLQRSLTEAQKSAGLLGEVPCSGDPMSEQCKLLASARKVREGIPMIEAMVEGSKAEAARLEEELAKAEALADAAGELAKERGDAYQAFDSSAMIATEEAALADARARLKEAADTRQSAVTEARAVVAKLDAEAEQVAELAGKAELLAGAKERIDDYQAEIDQATAQIERLTKEKAEIEARLSTEDVAAKLDELSGQIGAIEAAIEKLSNDRDAVAGEVTNLAAKIEAEKMSEEKRVAIRAELDKLKSRHGLLKILRRGLGPQGARALIIDAAGPAISRTINALLSECYGDRYQVVIRTQRETGKGDMKEALQLRVYDSVDGVETLVQNKSGGQAAFIGEAISLGLAVFRRQQTSAEIKTLIRDETTSALTDANGALYMTMLRKAVSMAGFDQVVFVTHKGFIAESADAILQLGGGKARWKGE